MFIKRHRKQFFILKKITTFNENSQYAVYIFEALIFSNRGKRLFFVLVFPKNVSNFPFFSKNLFNPFLFSGQQWSQNVRGKSTVKELTSLLSAMPFAVRQSDLLAGNLQATPQKFHKQLSYFSLFSHCFLLSCFECSTDNMKSTTHYFHFKDGAFGFSNNH